MEGTVTEEDRRRWQAQVAALQEIDTDDPGAVEQRRRLLGIINHGRVQLGLPPFPDPDEEPPELGFYERARALGMARRSRRDP